jgi:hypothetical protein
MWNGPVPLREHNPPGQAATNKDHAGPSSCAYGLWTLRFNTLHQGTGGNRASILSLRQCPGAPKPARDPRRAGDATDMID